MSSFYREHKVLFIFIAVGIFLLELEIFAMAAMRSGHKSRLQVIDSRGNVIHETDGANLSSFDRYYFEKTFGPFDQYEVKLISKDVAFPFRAWFSAAVGIPVGVLLLFALFVRAYQALFQGKPEQETDLPPQTENEPQSRLERIIARVNRFNIFTIGFLLLAAVLAYWVVPNVITYVGKTSLETLVRYRWIFVPLAAILVILVFWVIFLRYLLAKKSIESQAEVNKYRLQLELQTDTAAPRELTYTPPEPQQNPSEPDQTPSSSPAAVVEANFEQQS